MKKVLLSMLALLTIGVAASANNVKITNVQLSGGVNLTFDISWENSWNTSGNTNPNYPSNWDAVWVFVKVQSSTNNEWVHQKLDISLSNHSITGGILALGPATDGMGMMIRRGTGGSGNVSATATIRMQTLPAGTLNFRVFGTEMVYIPPGNFSVGDGGTGANQFFSYDVTSSSIASGALFTGSPTLSNSGINGYPTGNNPSGFYAAKYESSMQQMVDFLNTLTYDQQANLTISQPSSLPGTNPFNVSQSFVGNAIVVDTPGVNNTKPAVYACDANNNNIRNEGDDGQNLGCPFFYTRCAIAYLDWCGMRPMSELEYEKICRGSTFNGTPKPRVLNEYPWGNTTISQIASSNIINPFTDSANSPATFLDGRALISAPSNSMNGPGRVGLFAEGATGRTRAGAGFYGNMDLAGNNWETVVKVRNTTNPLTITSYGDGNLNNTNGPSNGDGNEPDWSDYLSGNAYWMIKGGAWNTSFSNNSQAQTSDRSASGVTGSNSNNVTVRGVR